MRLLFPYFFIFTFLISFSFNAQEYQPTTENIEAREWFQDARFGLFVHWGVYSVLGDGEWVMNNQNISIEEYEKLPSFFNPINFDPKEWVSIAKDAGMKYITITSRHHDGFSMFDSKATEYDIVDATPYGKDILKIGQMKRPLGKPELVPARAGRLRDLRRPTNAFSGPTTGLGRATQAVPAPRWRGSCPGDDMMDQRYRAASTVASPCRP